MWILHQKKQQKGKSLWQPVRHVAKQTRTSFAVPHVAKSAAMQQIQAVLERTAYGRDNSQVIIIPVWVAEKESTSSCPFNPQ